MLFALLSSCLIIFFASLGFGNILLHFHLTDVIITRLSLTGTGLLISSALTIIIPEGAEMIYAGSNASDSTTRDHADEHNAAHYVGIAIIFGFITMFLIDQIIAHPTSDAGSSQYIAVDNLQEMYEPRSNSTELDVAKARNDYADTFGLCIHSLADGIALGSSAQASAKTSIIVFIAIVVHKGPAAFGLVSLLLSRSVPRRVIQYHLLLFSISAPIGALFSFALVQKLGLAYSEAQIIDFSGLFLLFSGGTFLYVAVSHLPSRSLHGLECFSVLGGLILPVIVLRLIGHGH